MTAGQKTVEWDGVQANDTFRSIPILKDTQEAVAFRCPELLDFTHLMFNYCNLQERIVRIVRRFIN